MDHLCNFQEHLVNITASLLPHRERVSALLPRISESTPPGYRSLSTSQVTPSLKSPVRGSIVPNTGQTSNPVTTVQNPGSSSGSPISSTTRGKPPAQVVLVVSGVTSSIR